MRHCAFTILIILIFLTFFHSIYAVQPEKKSLSPDSVKNVQQKISKVEKRLEEIETKLEKEEQEKELQKLLDEAEKLKNVEKKKESGVGKKFHTGVRRQSGLNPNISVSGDFFGSLSSERKPFNKEPGEFFYGTNGFYLRELELSFNAPLDPFTRGKSFLSVSENEIGIEEAYVEWLNLPVQMNLKVGIFNPEFGILNRYHDHALPQFDRPKVLTNLFTNANMGGTGVAGNFLLKPLLGADASIFDFSTIHGGTGQSFTDQGELNLLYVGNFTNYYDLTSDTFLEWRLGGVAGHNDPAEKNWTTIGNVSLNIKWMPMGRSKYRTIDWKTEFFYSHRNTPAGAINSKGLYSSIQNKLNAQWWLTARFDYSEMPYDSDQYEWAATIGADFWQSDFVFLRFQYQYSQREFTDIIASIASETYPDDHVLTVQMNWAMGPHKHEAY